MVRITASIMIDLINEATISERLNILRNITGSVSLTPISLAIYNSSSPDSLPLKYHTCINRIDINIDSAVRTYTGYKGDGAAKLAKYTSFIRTIFLENYADSFGDI